MICRNIITLRDYALVVVFVNTHVILGVRIQQSQSWVDDLRAPVVEVMVLTPIVPVVYGVIPLAVAAEWDLEVGHHFVILVSAFIGLGQRKKHYMKVWKLPDEHTYMHCHKNNVLTFYGSRSFSPSYPSFS